MFQETPLLARARAIYSDQQLFGGENNAALNEMRKAENEMVFAAAYLAYYKHYGVAPLGMAANRPSAFVDRVNGLLNAHGAVTLKLMVVKPPVSAPIKGLVSEPLMGASDLARKQAQELRKKEGKGEYKGMRFQRPVGKVFGWYDGGRRNNVVTYQK